MLNLKTTSTDIKHHTRLEQIDVLRGIAALAVVVCHYSMYCQRYFHDFPFNFEIGRYGVQLFFVISGFFIFLTVERCASTKEFIMLRFSRLYPAYWLTLTLILIVDLLHSKTIWLSGYLVNATMLQSFIGFPSIDDVYWTLGVEMSFYFLMAFLLATRAIKYPIAVSLVWLLVSGLWFLIHGKPMDAPSKIEVVARILTYAPFFISGMMFYLIKKSDGKMNLPAIIVIFLSLMVTWWTSGDVLGIVAIVAFSLMAAALFGKLSLLVSPVTLWLGSISYSLYLVHRNLGYEAFKELNTIGVDSRIAFVIVITGALMLASAITYWIERPSLRILRTRISQHLSFKAQNWRLFNKPLS